MVIVKEVGGAVHRIFETPQSPQQPWPSNNMTPIHHHRQPPISTFLLPLFLMFSVNLHIIVDRSSNKSTFSLKMPHLHSHILLCEGIKGVIIVKRFFYFSLRQQFMFPQSNRPISQQSDVVHMSGGQQPAVLTTLSTHHIKQEWNRKNGFVQLSFFQKGKIIQHCTSEMRCIRIREQVPARWSQLDLNFINTVRSDSAKFSRLNFFAGKF